MVTFRGRQRGALGLAVTVLGVDFGHEHFLDVIYVLLQLEGQQTVVEANQVLDVLFDPSSRVAGELRHCFTYVLLQPCRKLRELREVAAQFRPEVFAFGEEQLPLLLVLVLQELQVVRDELLVGAPLRRQLPDHLNSVPQRCLFSGLAHLR